MKRRISLVTTLYLALVAIINLIIGVIVYSLMKSNPVFITEKYRPFSRSVLRFMSRMFSGVKFSCAEILLYLAAVVLLILLCRLVYVMISGCLPRIKYLLRFVSVIALISVTLVEFYYLVWGMNYFGKTLGEELGLEVRQSTDAELKELSLYLVELTNEAAEGVQRNADGSADEMYTFDYLADLVAKKYAEFTGEKEYPTKYVLASPVLSHMRTTGIFSFYTGESNVNRFERTTSLPFTMAHEISHRWGVAREDEANFMAFYVLHSSEEPILRYSVCLAALRYTNSKLPASTVAEIQSHYCDSIFYDNEKYSEYWSGHKTKVAEVSQKTNDRLLVINGVSDGVKSYGRMVDLLLAWYRSEVKNK